MPPSDAQPDDLATARVLIARLCDDRLDRAGAAALESLVCANPDVRRLYILTLSTHADLYLQGAFLANGSRSADLGQDDGDERPAASLHDLVIAPAIQEAPIVRPRRSPPTPVGRIGPPVTPWRHVRWAAAAGVAVTVGLWALAHRQAPPPVAVQTDPLVVSPAPSPVATTPAPSKPVPTVPPSSPPAPNRTPVAPVEAIARLDLSLSPVWAGQAPGQAIRPGDKLRLQSGLARLAMHGGTAVVLEGPADAVVDADHRLRLTRGRLTARSSHATTGFTVVTPSAVVTDVATEFALSTVGTGPTARTEVVILDGAVRLNRPGSPDAAAQTARAPQAFSISTSAIASLPKPSTAGPFVRDADFDRRKAAQAAALHPDLLIFWPNESDLDSLPINRGGPIGVHWRTATEAPGVHPAAGGFAAFLDVDTTSRTRQHGYVGPDGFIDAPGTTLYLSWIGTAQRSTTAGFGGLSLADGDRAGADERLYLGQPAGSASFACRVRSTVVPVLANSGVTAARPLTVDHKPHLWVVRLAFGAAATQARVYLDPPAAHEPDRAAAALDAGRLRFNRLRMAWGPHDYWRFTRVMMGSSYGSVVPP